jgi:hypothetical protein
MIPDDTDVFITRMPPFGILNICRSRQTHYGCPHLLKRAEEISLGATFLVTTMPAPVSTRVS